MPTKTASENDRLRSVDFLRTVGIAGALAVHLITAGYGFNDNAAVQRLWMGFAQKGSYGVTVFFVVSGFLITSAVVRQYDRGSFSLRNFYVRRVGRIVPLAVAVLALGAVAISALAVSPAKDFIFRHSTANFDGWFLASFPTFTFNWVRVFDQPTFGVHWDVFWSLAIEEQFYFIFPLLVLWLGLGRRMTTVMIGVVASGLAFRALASAFAPDNFLLGFVSSFGAFDLLAMGVLLALYRRHISGREDRYAFAQILGGLLLLVFAWGYTDLNNSVDRVWGPSAVGLGAALFINGTLSMPRSQRLFPSILLLPGRMSYGMYLLHGLVLFMLWDHLGERRTLLAFPMLFIATTVLAYVVFHFYEAPMNKAIRNRFLSPIDLRAKRQEADTLDTAAEARRW